MKSLLLNIDLLKILNIYMNSTYVLYKVNKLDVLINHINIHVTKHINTLLKKISIKNTIL